MSARHPSEAEGTAGPSGGLTGRVGARWGRVFSLKPSWRGLDARSLRLGTGLVLGLFFVVHFLNLGLGLVSARAMEAGRPYLTGLWHGPAGAILLYGAAALHFGLTLRTLAARRTPHLGAREAAQVGLGILLPFLLVPHVVATEIEPWLDGRAVDFGGVVRALWVTYPWVGARQMLALAVGWGHLCLGLWFWLRSKPMFPRAAPFLLAAALLVPASAMLGFAEAGKEVALGPAPPASAPPDGNVALVRLALELALAGSVGAVLAAQAMRGYVRRGQRVRVRYANGRVIAVPKGSTLLEASRAAQIPHVSMCGGRGRCSTCRVRVLEGLGAQPAASPIESHALARFKAAPNIRLACQLRPTHDLTIDPVFSQPPAGGAATTEGAGRERDLAVLFCDLRGFTRRAERWLPYDTVFILNKYFELVGGAVEAAGGTIDKFIGDGALALFGLEVPLDEACRQALRATGLIARGLDGLNAELRAELSDPLRVAMGLHAGPAVVGEMGFGRARNVTAIGDGINVASRLEGAAKEFDVAAVISTDVVTRSGLVLDYPIRTIAVRGREAPVAAILVASATSLGDIGDTRGPDAPSRARTPGVARASVPV